VEEGAFRFGYNTRMSTRYDLHSHSLASDGTLTPSELVARAETANVAVLALTDHDTTAGIREAESAARDRPLHLLPGVEISVTWQATTVHVVGLGIDAARPELRTGLSRLLGFRAWRAEEIGRRLHKSGISGAYEGARQLSGGQLIGRTHFARFLVAKGHAKDVRDVFRRYLVSGKPGHVPGDWARLEEAVTWIRRAGGQAVIAHPARYRFSRTKLRRLIGEFVECGGAAIEVVSGSHSRDDCFAMAKHAQDFGLLASAGSDYHGPENPWLVLGRIPALPHGCVPIWRDWRLEVPVRCALAGAVT